MKRKLTFESKPPKYLERDLKKRFESLEEAPMDITQNRGGVGYTRFNRFNFRDFFGKHKQDISSALYVGLGGGESNNAPPLGIFEFAAHTNAKVLGIDIRSDAVRKAKEILKTGKIVLSKRLQNISKGSLKQSPLRKYAKENGDFIIIELPKELRKRIKIKKADVALSTPLKPVDVVVATYVAQYVKPSHTFLASVASSLKKGGYLLLESSSIGAKPREPYMTEFGEKHAQRKGARGRGEELWHYFGFEKVAGNSANQNKPAILKKIGNRDWYNLDYEYKNVFTPSKPHTWEDEYTNLCVQLNIPLHSWSAKEEVESMDQKFPGFAKEIGRMYEEEKNRLQTVLSDEQLYGEDRKVYEHALDTLENAPYNFKRFIHIREKTKRLAREANGLMGVVRPELGKKLEYALETNDYYLLEKYLGEARKESEGTPN